MDITRSKFGTDSAITTANIDNVVRRMHLLGLNSEKNK